MRHLGIMLVAVATIAAPAAAEEAVSLVGDRGWGDARWGMTVAEVLAVLSDQGRAGNLNEPDLAVRGHPLGAERDIRMLGHDYVVKYHFTPTTNLLSMVKITATESKACDALEAYAVRQLGATKRNTERLALGPQRAIIFYSREWAKPRSGNRYSLTYVVGESSKVVACHVALEDENADFTIKKSGG